MSLNKVVPLVYASSLKNTFLKIHDYAIDEVKLTVADAACVKPSKCI